MGYALDEDDFGVDLTGNAVGIVLPPVCPVKLVKPCHLCPTEDRGDMEFEPEDALDADTIVAVVGNFPELRRTSLVGDEPLSIPCWNSHTKELTDGLYEHGITLGAITSGNTLAALGGAIEDTPGLERIAVSGLDGPGEVQETYRGKKVFTATQKALQTVSRSDSIRKRLRIMQVFRGNIEWLKEPLGFLQDCGITNVRVSANIDFTTAEFVPLAERMLDVSQYKTELADYTGEAERRDIRVVVDDLLRRLSRDTPGINVNHKPPRLTTFRLGPSGVLEAGGTIFELRHDDAIVRCPEDLASAITSALERSHQYSL